MRGMLNLYINNTPDRFSETLDFVGASRTQNQALRATSRVSEKRSGVMIKNAIRLPSTSIVLTMHTIIELNADDATQHLTELAEILVDAVDSGASVGFMAPFGIEAAIAYWQPIIAAIAPKRLILLGAVLENRLVGTVQLHFAPLPNQFHRADVAKLLVHRSVRRRGIGRALMLEVEAIAQQHQRTLLTLDTLVGDQGESLYRSLGYQQAGVIPGYAYFPNGILGNTSLYYKFLLS